MKIGIIGYGVVGKAAEKTFLEKYEVIKFDKYFHYDSFDSLLLCDFVFIMVPTPFDCKKNKVDDSAVTESLESLEKLGYDKIVVIKSTILPGSCEKYSATYNLNIVFNPEFLRESQNPNKDFKTQHTVVIGTDNSSTYESVKEMFSQVLLAETKYYFTTTIEAEMIKSAQNTMLASRVALANVIFDTCREYEVDYEKIKKIAFDSFDLLGPHMVQVPGPDGKQGFGGKCLPKDIRAFSTISRSEILLEIIKYNDSLRDDLDQLLVNFNKD